MRLCLAAALALLLAPAARADEDDPKMTRPGPAAAPQPSTVPGPAAASWPTAARQPATPPPSLVLPDEDDPKMARGAPVHRWWQLHHDVPRFKLAYRYLDLAALQGGTQHFDGVGLAVYPLSWLIRAGLDLDFAWGGGPYQMWLTSLGAVAGVQYPARVTPFLDGRFVVGVVGGQVMGSAAATWMYGGGVEGGVEIYYARRYYVSLAVGWMHPVYHGIDVGTAMQTGALVTRNLSNDTLTFKVGLGL